MLSHPPLDIGSIAGCTQRIAQLSGQRKTCPPTLDSPFCTMARLLGSIS